MKKHNHIEKQEFNFGGEFLFHYDESAQSLNVTLNPFYIPYFFKSTGNNSKFAKVLNVTGIIAENGAGKTTILNVLRENLAKGSGGVKDSMVVVFEHNGARKICHYDEIPIKGGNFADYGFSLEDISPEGKSTGKSQSNAPSLDYTTPVRIREFEHSQFIYFSSVFSNNFHTELGGTIDISTSYLANHDIIDEIENKRISRDRGYRELETHFETEIFRQINFINKKKDKWKLPIRLPDVLYIKTKREIDEFNVTFDEGDISIIKEYGFQNVLGYILSRANSEIKQRWSDWRIPAQAYFATACVINYLYELATNFRQVQSHVEFNFEDNNRFNDTVFLEMLEQIVLAIRHQADRFEIQMDESFDNLNNGVHHFLKKLPDFISDHDLVANNIGNAFGINIQEHPELFTEFTEVYNNAYSLKPFLGFSWRNMSSGEIAYLNIFSRFYSIIEKDLRFDHVTNDLVILIDEGELYLHPMWQKKFVKLILDYLPELFASRKDNQQRNLQIIFTTNSPIPASDLPNSNIIFLEKIDQTVIVKNSLEDKKFTLGANINTLLADSFFLKDGTIGDFAKFKINHIIEVLQGDYAAITNQQEYLERAIHMIGEPVVKHKLIQMLNERLNLNLANISQDFRQMGVKLQELEKEVAELKKNQNPK